MSILVVSGPVGAGKTTVARELLRTAPVGTVYIEGDEFWKFIVTRRPEQNPFKLLTMTMRAMFAAARHYDRDDYAVIVDFSVPPAYLPAVKRLLRDVPFHYVLLLPPEDVCAARAASRDAGASADYGKYHDFYRDFETDGTFVIRETLSAAELATRVRSGQRAGRFLFR